MMKLLLALALSMATTSVAAETVWGTEGGCQRHAGQMPDTDLVFLLYPDRVEGWESRCAIVGTEFLEADATILVTECAGEGDVWIESFIIRRSGGMLISAPMTAPDFANELKVCK